MLGVCPVTIEPYSSQGVYASEKKPGRRRPKRRPLPGYQNGVGKRIDAGGHGVERGRPRDWRTRSDPLNGVWESELEPIAAEGASSATHDLV